MNDAQPQAGPSRQIAPKRKPQSPHPQNDQPKRQKLPPPLPAKPVTSHPAARNGHLQTLPIKVLQGQRTKRTDGVRQGYGRDVIFVTRKISLGALMGWCRSLVVDEGYTSLTLFAMTAAIPHAMVLLHSLIDLLPYPKGPKGMWYELHTGTTECVDDVETGPTDIDDEDHPEFSGIGAVEAEETERKTRLNSTLRITLHMTPKPKSSLDRPQRLSRKKRQNRPSQRQRLTIARRQKAEKEQQQGGPSQMEVDEEDMMNAMAVSKGGMDEFEEEEEVEDK